jgi:phenylacetate-CoA ligase
MRRLLAQVYGLSCRKELSALRKAEHLGRAEVKEVQDARLAALLSHAYRNTAYYRRVLAETGLIKDGRVDLNRFGAVPLLTKDVLRDHLAELASADLGHRQHFYNTSGGSTGEPVRFVQDAEYKRWVRAVKLLCDEWTGYRPGMSKVVLWGSERDLFTGRETLGVRLNRWVKNEVWLNAFRMTEAQMRHYVQAINHHKPVQILAYVESIYELARFIEREGRAVHAPKAIMTSAGTLHPHMRESVERVFGAPVFNRYGSREVGDMACECEAHQGLHVSPLTHYLEILREDGSPASPGDVGEVVVTSLVNYAMPLIRYRVGDRAIASPANCGCKKAWPLLSNVVGRTKDSFLLADGTIVRMPDSLLFFKDWALRFQFIQEEYHYVRLLIVPAVPRHEAARMAEEERPVLEEKIRHLMGGSCQLHIDLVEDILPARSGKYQYTVSMVAGR